MVSRTVTVINKSGLHARPAATFTKLAHSFKCGVTVKKDGSEYNGKSIINILSAGIVCGTEIELVTDGEGEAEAMEKLVEAIESGLGE